VKVLKKVRFDVTQVDPSLHCLRGYEAYFSIQANKEYKTKRQMVWESVLREQARQRHLRIRDAMMMQLVSSHATQWARDTALELGMNDAQVALQIFLEYIQEQREDDDEFDDDDEEYDEAEYDAVNDSFNEGTLLEMPLPLEEDVSLRHDLDESIQVTSDCLEPLSVSSRELHRTRLKGYSKHSNTNHDNISTSDDMNNSRLM
jgi:hypothetical protein